MATTTLEPSARLQGQVLLHLPNSLRFSDDQFFDICVSNPDLHIERSAEGDWSIMAPSGGESGNRNSEALYQLNQWARTEKKGVTFDSSTGFVLPNGATRSPDAAWVLRSRLTVLTPEQKRKFLPLSPDFVVELRLETDSLTTLQEKMEEYVANGARLGWLIDPIGGNRIYVYRPGVAVETLVNPMTISADPELPGFTLDLADIWTPPF